MKPFDILHRKDNSKRWCADCSLRWKPAPAVAGASTGGVDP